MTLSDSLDRPLTVPPPRRIINLTMSDGATIRLRQHGAPGRPRLALSHGNGLAIDAYLPFWRTLTDDFELILFDVRNHGENPLHDPSAHSWERIAQDMGEIFAGIQTHCGKAPTAGVFHSLSAVAALLDEVATGPKWATLALFDPPIFPREGHSLQADQRRDMETMARRAQGRPPRYDSPEQFAAQLMRQRSFKSWVAGAHLLFAQTTLRPSSAGDWVLRNPRELEARIYTGNVDATLWPRLSALQRPTVLIAADPAHPDASPPASICREIHRELGIDYEMIPDTTHFLQIEKPDACHGALLNFLARHHLA